MQGSSDLRRPLPTSSDLDRHIIEHELPLRSAVFPQAEIVLRYGAFIGASMEHHLCLDRAMDRARAEIDATERLGRSVANGGVVVACSLRESRGRFARPWHAPAGGLWGCVVHANTLLPDSRRLLSLAVGVACCEAIQQEGAPDARLRWVNDVLIGGKKVAGFLIEGYIGPCHHGEYDLIGFGINLNNREFPEELRASATSLTDSIGDGVDLFRFTLAFLAKLRWNIGMLYFEEACHLSGEGYSGTEGQHQLLLRWKELSDTIGRRVVYGHDVLIAPLIRGRVRELLPDGALLIGLDDGSGMAVNSGEIRYL